MTEYALEMKGIRKEFPGVVALAGVDFCLKPGEVHALLGINGAGKSTLIKILSGVYQKDLGEIILGGKSIEIGNPQEAKGLGIATVYQDPQMIPSFTGYENIYLGSESESKSVFRLVRRGEMRKRAQQLIQKYPFGVDLTKKVRQLGTIERESIAILRALSRENTQVLILDEPTSILTRKEIDILFEQVEILKQRGIAIVYITHRLEEVFQIADRFTVLRDGQAVGTFDISENVDENTVAELMLGETLSQVYPPKAERVGEVVYQVENLSLNDQYRDVSFEVRQGEIVGIYGLVGSGFDELCKSLFGILPPGKGKVRLNGQEISLKASGDALKNGIFLVPGDRRVEGQILDESVSFNVTLANLKNVSQLFGLVRQRQEAKDTLGIIDQLAIKANSPRVTVSKLSGGNQQKVVIGKGIYTDSDLYIFEEPTVGVDVGAKSSIYHMIRDLSQDKAVIVASSDLEEVYGVCDRILVMYKGAVVMDKPAAETRLEEMLIHGLTGATNGKN